MASRRGPRWLPAGYKRLGATDIAQETSRVAPEFKEAGNWLIVTGGFVTADFLLHQLIPNTKGEQTPPYYYANKLIWTIPGLLVGRLLSDYVVKGSTFVRALTIATTCNLILAVRYLKSYPADYILTVGALHEAILLPLCFLITGPSPATGFFEKPKG
jgi:hypothetical protein